MYKLTLTAAALALLLAGPATAADPGKRGTAVPSSMPERLEKKTPRFKPSDDRGRGGDRHADRGRDRDDDHRGHGGERHGWRDDDHRDHDWRDDNHRDHNWRDDDRRHHDWDDHRWRDDDRRRDDDWRRRGWHYHGWRNDGWRYYRWHDNRQWRYVPPYRYSLDFGYRSGYELAWRDWLSYGRHDRYWRRTAFYGYGVGYSYRAGYEAGWRDAAYYYGRGYRPHYWAHDPHGGWYFSFRIEG